MSRRVIQIRRSRVPSSEFSWRSFLVLIFALTIGGTPSPAFAANQRSSHTQVQATISADPNPVSVATNAGTTTIRWDTRDGSWGQVFLSAAGRPEELFAEGPKGVQNAPWISRDTVYEFRLYARREHKVVLATVKVTAGPGHVREEETRTNPPVARQVVPLRTLGARLTATPNPVPGGDGTGTTTVDWNTGDGSSGQLYLYVPTHGGPEVLVSAGPRGSVVAPWIGTRATYEFRLYAGTDRKVRLATVTVSRALPPSAKNVPRISTSAKPVSWGGLTSSTMVFWDTADGSWGQVYWQVAGRPETIIAEGPSGFREVRLTDPGSHTLRLYAGRGHTRVAASTEVQSSPRPTGVAALWLSWPVVVLFSAGTALAIVAYARPGVLPRSGPYVVLVAAIAYFLIAASRNIRVPGLYYDEVLFVNAALGGINDSFIYKRILGVPFMIGNYLGALKAYIHFPIFRLFGVSPETVRLPMILLSAATLWTSFLVARMLWGRWLAALFAIVIATDPAFIFHARMDWGPAMLMLLLKMLALYFFFRLVQTRSVRYWWGLAVCLILGLYDKSIFIWFVLALMVASVICYRKELGAFARSYLTYLIVAFLGLGVVATLLLRLVFREVLNIQGVVLSLPNIERRISLAWTLLRSTMDGSATYVWVTGSALESPSLVYPVVAVCTVLFLGIVAWKTTRGGWGGEEALHGWFFLGLGALIFAQIVLTPQADKAHHVMMMYPFHHLVAVSAAFLSLTLASRWRLAARVLLTVLFAVLIISQHRAVSAHSRDFQETSRFNPLWSPGIYTLANYFEQAAPQLDLVVIGDWGIYNQLFALASTQTRVKYDETWRVFDTWKAEDTDRTRWLTSYFQDGNVAVVLHGEHAQLFPAARKNFLSYSSTLSKPPVAVVRIPDRSGSSVFEVYVYKGRATAASDGSQQP